MFFFSEIKHPYQIVLRAGSSNRIRGGFLYRAEQIVHHPLYDKARFNYDFSLIMVKKKRYLPNLVVYVP